jgi:hypothetical protein
MEPPNTDLTTKIVVASRMLRPTNFYEVGSLKTRNNNLQLILKLPLTMKNGETVEIKALIDTGAEANLIRMDLLPNHLFFSRKIP